MKGKEMKQREGKIIGKVGREMRKRWCGQREKGKGEAKVGMKGKVGGRIRERVTCRG